MSNNKPTSKQQRLKALIHEALHNSKYTNDRNLHRLYCMGLLIELLSYSAQDQMEVWNRLRQIRDRPPIK